MSGPQPGTGPFDVPGGRATISYGKASVAAYRSGVPPLVVEPVPGSAFTGRPGGLAAAEVHVQLAGSAFLDTYVTGDNARVIATDSMKNLVVVVAAEFGGATVEGLAGGVAARVLAEWGDVAGVEVRARELPYAPVALPGGGTSEQAWQRLGGAHQVATVRVARDGGPLELAGGIDDLELVRLSGSAFAGFVRDRFTTLPETQDRPLPIGVAARWWYADPSAASAGDPSPYVPREQAADVMGQVMHELASRSIQELVLAWGRRLLDTFPALARVELEAENRTWPAGPVAPAPGSPPAWTAPPPMYGVIRLALDRGGQA